MKARDLTPEHRGWYVGARHAKGILKVVLKEEGKVKIIVQDPKSKEILGASVELDEEIFAEKTLENQVKEEISEIVNKYLQWLRRKL